MWYIEPEWKEVYCAMINRVNVWAWECSECGQKWFDRTGERPTRCPRRTCRATAGAVPKEGRVEKEVPQKVVEEVRRIEKEEEERLPSWVTDVGLPRAVVPGKKCAVCGSKVEQVWIEEDNKGYRVCQGKDRHIQ